MQVDKKKHDGKGNIQRTTVAYFIRLLRETGIPKLVLGAANALLAGIFVVEAVTGGLSYYRVAFLFKLPAYRA